MDGESETVNPVARTGILLIFYVQFSSISYLQSITNSTFQILEVVRSHYDSLTLKLHESLDAYERYTERAPVAAFLSTIVRMNLDILKI